MSNVRPPPGQSAGRSVMDAAQPVRRLRVETPEQVELGFEIADLGSRFVALVLDVIILFLSLVALALLARWGGVLSQLSPLVAGWGLAATLLLGFVVFWGYFFYWEGFHNGRTPGKRWAGVRVIHEGGHPLTLRGAAIRNLVRVVDVQPVVSCLVGGTAMMLHPRTQRLGDMAAATLVIRDRGNVELTDEELERLVRAPAGERPRLPDDVFDALDRYAARRDELSPDARRRLSARLAEMVAEHVSGSAELMVFDEERLLAVWREEADRRATLVGSVRATPFAAALARSQANHWREYRHLLDRARRRGLENLSPHELERFAATYRATAADLARARTYRAAWPLVFSLERWVGAGHNLLYRPTQRSWGGLLRWLRHGFPALVRARARYVAVAAALLFLPAIGTFAAVRHDPVLARQLLPASMIDRATTANQRARQGGGYVDVPNFFMPVMSSGIVANNVQVTFLAFAGGILAGLGTIFLLLVNGVSIGAVAGLFQNQGAAAMLWEFVAPHGVIELSAVCIAGAAGLRLGSAFVFPGRKRRLDALADRAREGVSLLAGTTLMLALAALLEGFVSPAHVPPAAKLAIAAAVAVSVLAYLLLAGRGTVDEPAADVTAGPGT
ncbi:MAG: stage II sporulation protein M [Gemmatimonadota bacterium]